MSEILEWVADFAGKYAVVQAAMAAGVFIYLWTKVIRPGEREPPAEQELKAKWQAQQDLADLAENVKLLVTYTREMREAINRLTGIIHNQGQMGGRAQQ